MCFALAANVRAEFPVFRARPVERHTRSVAHGGERRHGVEGRPDRAAQSQLTDVSGPVDGLEKIERETEQNNELRAANAKGVERVVAELGAGRRLLQGPSVRSAALWVVHSGAFWWLLDKFAGHAIEPVVGATFKALKQLVGI